MKTIFDKLIKSSEESLYALERNYSSPQNALNILRSAMSSKSVHYARTIGYCRYLFAFSDRLLKSVDHLINSWKNELEDEMKVVHSDMILRI